MRFSLVTLSLLFITRLAWGQTVTSTGTGGNWSATGTWVGGVVPVSGDNVIIADGATVTINTTVPASGSLASLTIGQGTSGTLIFDATPRTITISGDVSVAAGGTFITQSATSATHSMTIGGNLANAGTFDMSRGGTTLVCNVTFNKNGNQTVSGTGSTTRFFLIAVDLGTSNSNILEISSTNFAASDTLLGRISGTVGLKNGTLKMSGSYTFSAKFFSPAGYTIPSTAGIWLNNSNVTVTGQNGSPTLNGLLRISTGTYNVGTSSGNSIDAGAGAIFTIEGGTLNVAGRLLTANAVTYNQSGGTVNVSNVGNGLSGSASFGLTSASSTVNMTGGTIVLVQRNSTTGTILDYRVDGTGTLTGTTLQVGKGTTATNFDFRIHGNIPNLVIDNTTNNKQALLSAASTIFGNVTINTGSTLDLNGFGLTMSGGTFTNNGTFTTGTQLVTFNGNTTIGGSSTTTFAGGFTVNTNRSVTLSTGIEISAGTGTVNGTLNCGTNVVTGAGAFTLASGGTLGIGSTAGIASSGASGNIQVSGTRTFDTGANYTYNGSSAQVAGNGLPSSVNNLTINNSAGLTLTNSVTANGALNLQNGIVATGANTLGVSSTGSVSRTNGHVSGNLQMFFGTGDIAAKTFHIGMATDYTPATVDIDGGGTGTAGTLTATTTGSAHSQIASSGLDVTKDIERYWRFTPGTTLLGGRSYKLKVEFLSGDVGGVNTDNFEFRKYNGGWTTPTGGTYTRTGTSTQYSNFTSFSDFAVGEPIVVIVEPTTQAHDIIFSSIGATSIEVSWTSGNGTNRLVVAKAESAVDADPVEGTSYTANSTFGSGSQIGTGNYVVYSGSSNSAAISGLAGGTTYHFRVYEFNGSGSSTNYLTSTATGNPASQVTVPSAPTATPASNITTTSFTANWGSVTGATGYRLDVSTENIFSSYVSGFENLSVEGISQSVTGLSTGTTYYYRVRAENSAGSSTHSGTITVLTLPAAPTANAGSNITTSSFEASWNSVAGASGYRLDVATDDGFTSLVSGYSNLSVGATSKSVTGLSASTTYYYRVRAENATGVSAHSNTITVTTATPANSTDSDIIETHGFSYPTNIAYTDYQENDNLTEGNSLAVFGIQIRDGGASAPDTDDKSTILTAINFDVTNSDFLRRAALYDGSTELGEVAVSGSTITFSGLSATAVDNGTKDLTLRVTFTTAVTDNGQFSFTVSSVTAASDGSIFASANGGGASSSTTGDINRIEVTATKLDFTTQPSANAVVGTALSIQPVVTARDINNLTDSDYSGTVTLTNSGSLGTSGNAVAASSGVTTFTGLTFNASGIGITLTTSNESGLTNGTSNAIVILDAEPATQASAVSFSGVGSTSMTVNWTNGSGSSRIVLMKSGSAVSSNPVDGTSYTANATFGDGTQIGTGNYVVYTGDGNSVVVTGLIPRTTYHFAVFEFNGTSGSENYLTTSPAIGSQLTSSPTYTWNAIGTASWTTASNWTPNRTFPTSSDILQFNGGGTVTVTDVPAQTIGQLLVANNSVVNLQASLSNTLTIGGGAETDLDVASGSALNVDGSSALTILLVAGGTGSISGTMTFRNAAHKLNANDASAITFHSGSYFTQGTGCTGNVFTNAGTASVIVFASGSTFEMTGTGSNPFALTAPSSKVVFQTGSLYKHSNTSTPSFSGRTYPNFELNSATAFTVTGGSAVSIGNLTITAGTLNFNMTGTPGHSIKGNISVASGQTLNFNPSSAGTVNLNGTSQQSITGSGSITTQSLSTLTISNSSGVALGTSIALNGTLALLTGTFSIGANTLTLNAALSITGGSLSGGATSNIEVAGSGTSITLPSLTLYNLTLNRANGITLNGAVEVQGTLTLTEGILSLGGNTFTLGNGSTISRSGGSLSAAPTFGTSVNLGYTGSTALTTGIEMPNSASVLNNLSINNSAGVSLGSSATVNGILTLTNGNLTTNLNTLTLGASASITGETTDRYVIGTLITSRTVGTSSSPFGGIGVTLAEGTDNLGNVTVTRVSGSAGAVTANEKTGINRKWSISSTNPPTSGRSLTLGWISNDDNSRNLTTAQMWRKPDGGSNWLRVGSAQNASSSRQVTANVTSFSDFTVSDADNPLAPVPSISIGGTISDFGNVVVNSISSEKSYTVLGTNLSEAITITPPSGFELSTGSGGSFVATNPIILTESDGTVANTTIYVRFTPSSTGVASGNITHTSSGATTQNQAVSGTGIETEPTSQASNLTFSAIGSSSMTLNWTNGDGASRIVLAKAGSAVNSNPVDGISYTSNMAFGSGSQIGTGNYVVYSGSGNSVTVTGLTTNTSYHYAVYEFNGTGGTENYLTATAATGSQHTKNPTITLTGTLENFGSVGVGLSSSEQSYTVAGTELSQNITITAPTGFAVSTTSGSGFTSSLELTQTGGNVPSTTIYVRFSPTLVSTYNANITHTSLDAVTKNMAVAGTGVIATRLFRSIATGNWGSSSSWEISTNGGSTWSATTEIPSSVDASITVRNGHVITIAASRTADELTIEAGGQLTIASGQTLTIANGSGTDLAINGTLLNSGTLTISSNATWAVDAGGTFIHNSTSSSSTLLGTSPTLSNTSTWIYRGSSIVNASVSISNRTFGNLSFESSSGSWTPTSTSGSNALTINGNFSAGMSGAGTVSYNTTGFTGAITIVGNLLIGTNGTLTIGSSSLSLGAHWTNSGTFNPGTSTVTFNGSTGQTFTRTGTGSFNNLTLNNSNGLTLNNDATVSGTLTLTSGALSIGGNTLTLNGAVSVTSGGLTGGSTSNLIIGGTGAVTLPGVTLNNLTLNRASGITLASNLTIEGVLTFTSGKLSTGANKVILGTSGSVSGEGVGKYVVGTLEVTRDVGTGAHAFSGIGVSFAAGSGNPGSVTIVRTSGSAGVVNTGTREGITRKWRITTTNNVVRDISFGWVSDDNNGKDVSSIQIWNREVGGAWQFSGSSQSGASYVVNSSGFNFVGGTSYELTILEGTVITVSPSALPTFRSVGMGSSSSQSYMVSGNNFNGDVTINTPDGFKISLTQDANYINTILLSPVGGTLAGTTIYVRFMPDADRHYSANISHTSSGAANKNVSVQGSIQWPEISTSAPSILDFGKVFVNSNSAVISYKVSARELAGPLTVIAPQEFQVSTSATGDFRRVISIPGEDIDESIYVRYSPTTTGLHSSRIMHTSVAAAVVYVNVKGTSVDVLVAEPTLQSSSVVISNVEFTSMQVRWKNGNGGGRIVLAKAGNAVDVIPQDLNSYGAQSEFSKGSEIGSGNFVVYAGSDSSVTITGLKQGTTYHFAVFEYNGSGEDINYLTTNPARGSAKTREILLSESFDSPIGTLLLSAGWSAHSGAGTNSITITSAPLVYQGWPLSGVGNGVSMTTSGEDVNKSIKPQSSGSVFVGVLVNIMTAQTGDYFFHFGPDPIGSTYRGRVFVKDDGAGKFQFGLSKSSTTNVNYTTTKFSYNTTYLLILEYQIISGSSNDIVSLYINPLLGSSQSTSSEAIQSILSDVPAVRQGGLCQADVPALPAEAGGAGGKSTTPDLVNLDTDSDITVGSIALRQGTSTSAPTLVLSGVRVAPSWDDLLVQSSTPSVAKVTATLTSLNFGDVKVSSPSGVMSYSVSGSNLTGALNISSPNQFEIGTSASGPFGSTLSLTPTGGTVSQTTVYVRFTPSSLGTKSGNVLHTSEGADTAKVAVSGIGVEETAASQSIQITSFGIPLAETFDGIGTAGTSYVQGWTGIRFGGTGTVGATLTPSVGDGSSSTGNVYNVGTTGASDHALGTLASGTTVPAFGAQFINKTGGVVGKIDFAGVMEQWRSGSSNTANEIVRFEYSLNAAALNNGTWTALTGMDLLEKLTTTTTAAAVNGNELANRTIINGSVPSITWRPDSILWIRWVDTDDSGSDGLYAIDNFSITVYPPSGLADGDGIAIVRNPNLNNSDVFKRNAPNQIAEIVVTGTTTGTLTSVNIDVPTSWTGLSSANVSLSGPGLAGANAAVSGNKITLSNCSITDANTGTVRVTGLTTPNPIALTDIGNYTFVVQTAKTSGTLTSIKTSPKAFVVIPIASLRDNDPNGVTLDLGATVATQGVNLNQTSFDVAASEHYLQDGTVGIRVYRSSLGLNLSRGNRYIAKGEVTNSNGRTTIVSTFIHDDGSGVMPQPATRTIKEILANPEALDGTLVLIPSVSKKSGTWPTTDTFSNLIVGESTGTDSITLRLNLSTGGSKEPSYPVNIAGILSQFDSTPPYTEGYQILPRDSVDIGVSSTPSSTPISKSVPSSFALIQNYPNPFNPSTVIRFELPIASDVVLSVFDMLGREVARLVDGNTTAGRYQVTWNADNYPSGIYFYQLRAGETIITKRMMLMR